MATWQHNFIVLSTDATPPSPARLAGLGTRLDAILGREKSWSADILQWGNIDRTVFKIMTGADGTELSFRLDMRGDWRTEVTDVWHACRDWGFCFAANAEGEPGRTFENIESIIDDCRASDAARFVSDPRGFLDSLG